MKIIIKKAALAAAIISAPLAASATDLVGGGASLPALAYVGDDFTTTNPQSRLSSDVLPSAGLDSVGIDYEFTYVTTGSIFSLFQAANPLDTASYCQTGSGIGVDILIGGDSPDPDSLPEETTGDCRDHSVITRGFSALSGKAAPDFVSSSAPLTAEDVTIFLSGPRADREGLVQVPALSSPIALPLNLGNDVFGNPITRPNLSNAQVCDIFSGDATSWDQINPTWPAQPIYVIYRPDESGTSFAFTQYLAANCNGSQVIFQTGEDFEVAAPTGNYMTYWLLYRHYYEKIQGETALLNLVEDTPWSIGYAGIAGVLARQSMDYADVEGEDPADTTQIAYGSNDLLTGQVLGDISPFTGLPQPEPVSGIDSNCLLVINPAAQLTGAYPIHAVINLLTYTDGHTDPQALEELIETVVDGSSILPTGFARLTVGATASATAASCIN